MNLDDANGAGTEATKRPGGITGKGFLPGRSGNPSGRPKKSPISDRYAAVAELPCPEYLLGALKLTEAEKPAIKTYGDALVLSQFRAGIKGKTDAAREIADRLEGRAAQRVGVDINGTITIDRIERMERRWRERAAQRSLATPGVVKVEP